jgi:DMSO/TMAO reductase YedYZ molybdopterin-dependent catalytic subunit
LAGTGAPRAAEEMNMTGRQAFSFLVFLAVTGGAFAQDKVKIDASTPTGEIIMMDPGRVDAANLPLTSVESLHSTGAYQSVEVESWRLTISGVGIPRPLSLSYSELMALPMVKKRVILICPGFFYDYLEWEGVPLETLLRKAGAGDFTRVAFTSVDGYTEDFKRQDLASGLVMVAFKGNGTILPRAHGFPARVVAEGIYGSRWVKYLTAITLE